MKLRFVLFLSLTAIFASAGVASADDVVNTCPGRSDEWVCVVVGPETCTQPALLPAATWEWPPYLTCEVGRVHVTHP